MHCHYRKTPSARSHAAIATAINWVYNIAAPGATPAFVRAHAKRSWETYHPNAYLPRWTYPTYYTEAGRIPAVHHNSWKIVISVFCPIAAQARNWGREGFHGYGDDITDSMVAALDVTGRWALVVPCYWHAIAAISPPPQLIAKVGGLGAIATVAPPNTDGFVVFHG
jgi:hypothetical protein